MWQEHRDARADIIAQDKELEFAPEFAMIALQRLFQAPQMLVQLLLREPGRPINALQHRATLITTPVRSRHTHEFEGTNLARIFYMWTTTQVQEVALLIDADFLIGQILNDLDLVDLTLIAEVLQCLLAGPAVAQEWILFLNNAFHTPLNLRQIIGCERTGQIEIIVETIFDS